MREPRAAQVPSSLLQGVTLLRTAIDRERSGRSCFSGSRMADQTGIERSRASRLIQELTALGLLERGSDATFRSGPAYLSLAAALHRPWLHAARRELRRITSGFGTHARVHAADGPRAVLLRFEAAPGAPASATNSGTITPIWCTGGGRALLWNDTRDMLERRLQDAEFVGVGGPRAARSPQETWELLEEDRYRGFILADQEFEFGILEVASPIFDGTGQIIGGLSASCSSGDERAEALAHEVSMAARRLGALAAYAG